MEFSGDAPEAQPEEETPARPLAPEGAVDVLVDGVPVCTVVNEEEAAKALRDVLNGYSAVPEGERLLRVVFLKEVTLENAQYAEEVLTGDQVFTLLYDTYPSLCPVERVTEK